jgi:uncharacterized protein YgiM (DUF1202 family)
MRKTKQIFVVVGLLGLLFVASEAQERTATVIQSRAYLRVEPMRKAAKVKRLKKGVTVTVLTAQAPWYEVESDGKRGWVHGNAIRFDDAAADAQAEMSSRKPKRSRATVARVYFRGPRGGCYYLSGSGRKVYVDRSLCN